MADSYTTLRCRLFGHRWRRGIDGGYIDECRRCRKRRMSLWVSP